MNSIEQMCLGDEATFNKQCIDWHAFQVACLHKNELMIRLLKLFVSQTPHWLEQFHTFIAAQDREQIRSLCHTVKGAMSAMRAEACFLVVDNLHTLARKEDEALLLEGEDAYTMIRQTFSRTTEVTEKIIKILEKE